MADGYTVDAPAVGDGFTFASDDIVGVHYPRLKITAGADGSATDVQIGGGTEAAALRVTIASDSTGLVSVDDGGSSLTVDNAGLTELASAINASAQMDVNLAAAAATVAVSNAGLTELASAINASAQMDVNVATALPAGTNNIGDVDVLSSALPTGAATAANQSTIIGHLDGVETLLTTIDADTGTLAVVGGGTEATALRVTIANNSTGVLSVDDNGSTLSVDDGGSSLTVDGTLTVRGDAFTSGGWTPYKLVSAATTNATSVKASAGQLGYVVASNVNAAARYLKLYDKASAPTVGTDTPVHTLIIPGNTAGAGIVVPFPIGAEFANGIAFALTTLPADDETTGVALEEIVVNLGYA